MKPLEGLLVADLLFAALFLRLFGNLPVGFMDLDGFQFAGRFEQLFAGRFDFLFGPGDDLNLFFDRFFEFRFGFPQII